MSLEPSGVMSFWKSWVMAGLERGRSERLIATTRWSAGGQRSREACTWKKAVRQVGKQRASQPFLLTCRSLGCRRVHVRRGMEVSSPQILLLLA